MGGEVHRPDFSRGPRKRADDGLRKLHLKGVTELPVGSKELGEPVQEAAGAMVVFKLLRDELRDVAPGDFRDLVAELHEAAADRRRAMEALTPAALDLAVNQARREVGAYRQERAPQPPDAA